MKRYDLKNSDIVLALVPAIFLILIFGDYTKIRFSSIELEKVYEEVSTRPIDVGSIRLDNIPYDILQKSEDKVSIGKNVPPFEKLGNQYESISLTLGSHKLEPLDAMNISMNVRYIVLNKQDSTFWGLIQLSEAYRNMGIGFGTFVDALYKSDTVKLSKSKNFLSLQTVLTPNTSNADALVLMDSLEVDILPIVNDKIKFIGLAKRNRIASSLILGLLKALKNLK